MRPLHVSGIDPRHLCQGPTHVGTHGNSGQREEMPLIWTPARTRTLIQVLTIIIELMVTSQYVWRWREEKEDRNRTGVRGGPQTNSPFPYLRPTGGTTESPGPTVPYPWDEAPNPFCLGVPSLMMACSLSADAGPKSRIPVQAPDEGNPIPQSPPGGG